MAIDHVLAVVPVADLAAAQNWYERLFGRTPDNNPMDTLVEWRVTDNGWVQVTVDAERSGTAMLNLAVGDIERHVAEVTARGLHPDDIQTVSKGVQLCPLHDPAGNLVTLLGGFRVDY